MGRTHFGDEVGGQRRGGSHNIGGEHVPRILGEAQLCRALLAT